MTLYYLPDGLLPSSQTFELVTNTKTFQSPLSNAIQTISRKGSYWKTSMTFNNLNGEQRNDLKAVLSKLNGQEHRLAVRDYGHLNQGNYVTSNTPYLDEIRSSTQIVVNNVTPNIAGYLKAGDYIIVNGEYKIVVDDADSNASFRCLINIAPPLRDTTTLSGRVYFLNERGTFIVTNNPQWRNNPPYFSSITIEAVEDVLA